MKLVLQIALGIVLGVAIATAIKNYMAYQVAQQYLEQLKTFTPLAPTPAPAPRYHTETMTIPPRSKHVCIKVSKGIYNDIYLMCRKGIRKTIRTDTRTNKQTILRIESVLDEINVP